MRLQAFLNQAETFVWVVDNHFVIPQKIVTNNSIQFDPDCLAQYRKKISHHHRHLLDPGTAYHKRIEYSCSNSNLRTRGRARTDRRWLYSQLFRQLSCNG